MRREVKERLLRGDGFERSRQADFDPITESKRYGLAPDVSTAIWDHARREATNHNGLCDQHLARERFAKVAKHIANRGGQFDPPPFKWTQVDVASNPAWVRNVTADRLLARASGHVRVGLERAPGRTTLVAGPPDSCVCTPEDSRGFFRRYMSGACAARYKLDSAIASRDHYAALVATIALKQDLRWARHHLANGLAHDEGLQAALESLAEPLLAKMPNMSAGDHLHLKELLGPDSAQWRAAAGVPAEVSDLVGAGEFTAAMVESPMLRAERIPPASDRAAERDQLPGASDVTRAIAALQDRREVDAPLASLSSGAGERPASARLSRLFEGDLSDVPVHSAVFARPAVAAARGATLLRRETEADADPSHPAVTAALAKAGRGEPLPDAVRSEMEARLGADFRHACIHTDSAAAAAARALRARAFTLGEDIFFAEGTFSPADVTGELLLVHELTHVVQAYQGRIGAPGSGWLDVSHPADALEREAETASIAGPSSSGAHERSTEHSAERPIEQATERRTERPAAAGLRAGVLHLSPDPARAADPFDEDAYPGFVWRAILWQYTVPTLPEARAAAVTSGLVNAADLDASVVTHIVRGGHRYSYWSYRHPSKGVIARIMVPSFPMGNQLVGNKYVDLYSADIFLSESAWQALQNSASGDGSSAVGGVSNKTGADRDASGRLVGGADRDAKLKQLPAAEQVAITGETNRVFWERTGYKKGQQLGNSPQDKQMAKAWMDIRDELVIDRERIAGLPEDVKAILFSSQGKVLDPKDYQTVLAVADKLAALSNEDRAAFKLLPKKAADDITRFAKAVDLFIARKAELRAALDAELKKTAAAQAPTMQGAVGKKWEGMDESKISTMSEADRYALARQKTSELTEAQLTYMAQHPGETLGDFAKSATLMNTGDTFKGIGKDLAEAASGDANSWARWAAGTGAGAKMSGWLVAVAGILYAASWLTGVGELATIAAAGMVLLGTTLTLSLAESELRIKAASQATTPEEFKRNVELAAAARANVAVGVALIVLAAVLHFTAKALFPKTLEAVKTSLKNFRERVRLKGSIYELKPQIASELGLRKGELAKAAELSKQKAQASAAEIEGMTTEQFVDKTEAGGDGFLDQSKLPPEQRVNFRELLKTPEGRKAIEGYKQRLVKALKIDVPAQIDQLAQEYVSKLDDFLKDIDAAKNHDDLSVAVDKLDDMLTDEHAKKFMDGQQQQVTKQKLEEAAGEAHQEMLATLKEAIVKRVKARIAEAGADFALTYSDAEFDAIVKRGKELGLSDKMIEDLIYVGSRVKKAIAAADLMDQMKNWATEIQPRGYPYRFDDLAQFKQFSKDLLDGVQRAGLPTDDVRMQGSSLRKPAANDVDIAVFVEEAVFDKLLVDRYDMRVTKGGTKVSLAGKSHAEFLQLAADIEANPGNYNAQGSTFQNAIKSGIINSKSDIVKPLKPVRVEISAKYPNLNIETISVLIRGGRFELLPDLPVKANN